MDGTEDRHEAASGHEQRAKTARAARARARKKPGKMDDGSQARARMENALLDAKKALAHCPMCGAQGNWLTDGVSRPVRYLLCGHCRVGRIKIVVTDEEVAAALGAAGGG